jgi:hypothetical protein
VNELSEADPEAAGLAFGSDGQRRFRRPDVHWVNNTQHLFVCSTSTWQARGKHRDREFSARIRSNSMIGKHWIREISGRMDIEFSPWLLVDGHSIPLHFTTRPISPTKAVRSCPPIPPMFPTRSFPISRSPVLSPQHSSCCPPNPPPPRHFPIHQHPTFCWFFWHSFDSSDILLILPTFFIFFRHSCYSSPILSVLPTFFLFLQRRSYSDYISLFFQHSPYSIEILAISSTLPLSFVDPCCVGTDHHRSNFNLFRSPCRLSSLRDIDSPPIHDFETEQRRYVFQNMLNGFVKIAIVVFTKLAV